MLHLIKDLSSHVHVEFFGSEDEAYAFIHGVYLGAHQPTVSDTHGIMHYSNDEFIAEALVYGLAMGIQHRSRIEDTEVDLGETGFKVTIKIAKENV